MYRRPKFLELLLEIRQEMAREADYDADLFAEMLRGDSFTKDRTRYVISEPKVDSAPVKNGRRTK